MANTISRLGTFPASGEEAREKALFYKLTDEDGIKMISGKNTPALLSVWCSNDVVQFGTVKLLTGGVGPQQTEFDSHAGDTVFHVLEGTLTFFIRDRKETYTVKAGDFMFIPEGETYKIINYYGDSAKAVFAIAPEL